MLFSDIKGWGDRLSKAMVFHSTSDVDKGIDLPGICISICQATFGYVGFNDFTDNQDMASQIQVMDSLTLQIYRAFLN